MIPLLASLVSLVASSVPITTVHGAPAPVARTTTRRPLSIMLEQGFGGPVGLLGVSVGYHPSAEVEVGGGFGLGFTGYQASLMARWTPPVGRSPTMSWVLGAGPSLGFRSQALGLAIEHADGVTVGRDELFYTAWLNGEAGWEGRARWGGTLRIVLGVELRVADNQRHLCDGATEENDGDGCFPPHFGPGSAIAKAIVLPYMAFAYGWSF